MKKDNEIKLGTFFGQDVTVKDHSNQDLSKEWWIKQWENWIEFEGQKAVQEYKDELFFKDLEFYKK